MATDAALRELCELIVDCPHSTPKWTESGVLVLRSQNIRDGRLNLTEQSFTDEAHYKQRSRRAELRPGDLVITREAPMGEACMVPEGLPGRRPGQPPDGLSLAWLVSQAAATAGINGPPALAFELASFAGSACRAYPGLTPWAMADALERFADALRATLADPENLAWLNSE